VPRATRPTAAVQGLSETLSLSADAFPDPDARQPTRTSVTNDKAGTRRRVAPSLAMPSSGSADTPSAGPSSAVQLSKRSETVAAATSRETHGSEQRLAGVPLATLAACITDRAEDSLKRKLVAAVDIRSKCVSAAGTYHFVETKNLNAFSMLIERSPGREAGDRCDELELALTCVTR